VGDEASLVSVQDFAKDGSELGEAPELPISAGWKGCMQAMGCYCTATCLSSGLR